MIDEPLHSDGDRLITVDEVARLLSVDRSQVYRLRAAGRIPDSVRVGSRSVRWKRSEILAFIANL